MRAGKVVPKSILVVALGAALQACGGGGNGDDGFAAIPPGEGPALGTGVFKDSNVAGLSYTSGGHSGVTGADGTFTFEQGATTVFKVGAVTLGSTSGSKDLVTPIDLVPNGTSTTPAVVNIARFLMMLDSDGLPDSGIVISENVRGRAATWSSVNFSDARMDALLTTLAADARSADGGVHNVPTGDVARMHVENTLRCAHSGAYRGTFSGADQGRFTVIIAPNDGNLVGIAALSMQLGAFAINPTSPLSLDQNLTVSGRSDRTGATFTGKLSGSDTLSGTYAREGTSGGTFTGNRLLAKRDAVWRYSGFFADLALPETGTVTFDVNASGQVTGVAYGLLRDQLVDFTGTLSNGVLDATATNGAVIHATSPILVLNTLVNGTWTGTGQASPFSAFGCKLN
jgi:hypothetical protein